MFEYGDVDDAALVERLQIAERSIAAAQAEQLAVIAELNTRAPAWITTPDPLLGGADPMELTVAEVGAALRISKLSASARTELAVQVTARLPGTLAAMRRGQISMAKLRIIAEATEELSAEHAKAVEDRVLPRAVTQTPAGLGVSVSRAVIRTDPTAAERRRKHAVRERTAAFYPAADGMATIWLRAPAAAALAAFRRLCELAETARTPGDERTSGARRADALIDLILNSADVLHLADRTDAASGSSPSGPGGPSGASGSGSPGEPPEPPRSPSPPCDRARPRWGSRPTTVHVTVPWTTLAGIDDLPAQLAGYGPITAEAARELAADATWRRILTDPDTGAVRDVGTTTYTPPAGLAAHVRARDGTCRWPGCRLPAQRCDLDHTEPYPRGPTADYNLAALCRPHHRLKTHTTWQVTQGTDGVLAWTSPTGQQIDTEPWTADHDPHHDPHPDPDPPEALTLLDDDPPLGSEPDWLYALPTGADIATRLTWYDTVTEFECFVDESDSDAA